MNTNPKAAVDVSSRILKIESNIIYVRFGDKNNSKSNYSHK